MENGKKPCVCFTLENIVAMKNGTSLIILLQLMIVTRGEYYRSVT
jgi:hypothetical protein